MNKIIISILLFLAAFTPLAFGTVQQWSITLLELFVIIAAILWFCQVFYKEGIELQKTTIYIPMILFVGLLIFQIIPVSADILKIISPESFKIQHVFKNVLSSLNYQKVNHFFVISLCPESTVTELYKIITYFLVFFLTINIVKKREQVELFIFTILTIGFLISVFGIIQKYSFNSKIYWLQPLTSGGEPFGPFVCRDHYGGYINMIIPLGLGLLMSTMDRSRKILFGFISIIMIGALFIAASRGAILSFFAGLVLFGTLLLILGSGKKSFLLFIVTIICGILFVLWLGHKPFIDRFALMTKSEYYILYPRVPAWAASLEIIKNYFVFGTGGGTFEQVFAVCRPDTIGEIFEHLHNDYLQVLFETGVIGFLILSSFMILFFRHIVRRLKRSNNLENNRGLFIGGIVSIVTIISSSFLDFNLRLPGNDYLFFLILGLMYNFSGLDRDDEIIDSDIRTLNITTTKRWHRIVSVIVVFGVVLLTILPIIKKYVAYRSYITATDKNEYKRLYRALKWNPANSEYNYRLGLYYQKDVTTGSEADGFKLLALNQAKQKMVKAVSLCPVGSKYWSGLGWVLSNLGKDKEAEECFKMGVQLEPCGKYPHLVYALWCIKMAKDDKQTDKQKYLIQGSNLLKRTEYLLSAGLDRPQVIKRNREWFDNVLKNAKIEDMYLKK